MNGPFKYIVHQSCLAKNNFIRYFTDDLYIFCFSTFWGSILLVQSPILSPHVPLPKYFDQINICMFSPPYLMRSISSPGALPLTYNFLLVLLTSFFTPISFKCSSYFPPSFSFTFISSSSLTYCIHISL